MRCRESRELVSGFFDNTLSPEETAGLHGHVRSCPGCRSYLEDEQIIWEAVRSVLREQGGPTPDAAFTGKVLAALGEAWAGPEAERRSRRLKRESAGGIRLRRWAWGSALAVACLLVLLVTFQARWQPADGGRVLLRELRPGQEAIQAVAEVSIDDLALDHVLRSSEHPLIGGDTAVAVLKASSVAYEAFPMGVRR